MMATKRTPSTVRHRKRITPENLALFRRGPEASAALDLALGRPPWAADIFEALDNYRDTEITKEMIFATRGRCVVAQWGLIKDARDLGLELERLTQRAERGDRQHANHR